MPKNQTKRTRVETTIHDEAHRSNIPTTELGSFLDDQEKEPTSVLYPRDPSLDPQLVWKGKDEQDRHPLEVPAVPIYIQEKIHPKALIEALRAEKAGADAQLNLWADFNGIDFDELVEFYQHEQNWSNRMILGDSLLVMTSLAEKEGLKGQVQMIYMDPPYGIKFGSNWQVSTRKREVSDGKVEDATRQPEQVKAFRDTWELGIHSYLSYMRDRLVAARNLLVESGSLFVQIGEDNLHFVRCLLDEVFGGANSVALISFATTGGLATRTLSRIGDYVLWYAKSIENLKYRQLFFEKQLRQGGGWAHSRAELEDGTRANLGVDEVSELLANGRSIRPYSLDGLTSQGASSAPATNEFAFEGKVYRPGSNAHWKTTLEGMRRLAIARRVEASTNSVRYVRFLGDFPVQPMTSTWADTNQAGYIEEKRYVVQTITRVIQRCMLMSTDPGDLVLDPTCGSGTTAVVAEQWGRRWITIDTSRVALALARQRLMSAKYPYYLLADSIEGRRLGGLSDTSTPHGDIRKGFAYKRVPHVTLKSIANNP